MRSAVAPGILLDGYSNAGRCAAELIRRVKRVRRGHRRSHHHTGAARRPDLWRNDVVHAIGRAPTQRRLAAGRDRRWIRREARDCGRGTGRHICIRINRPHLDHIEIRGRDALQQIEIGVVPSIVRIAADENTTAVVSQNQAVFLHCGQDHLVVRWKAGSVETGFEAKPCAHRWSVGVGEARSPM